MNTISRTISGIALSIGGLFVILVTLSEEPDTWSRLWGMAWGMVLVGIGVYILFNKKEDNIEEINDASKK